MHSLMDMIMNVDLIVLFTDVLIGLCIGISIGMIGIGGGALIQPSLIHILGMSPVSAVGTGLAYAMITKVGGFFFHLKLKTIKKTLALYFLLGSIPGVLLASNGINYLMQNFDKAAVNKNLQIIMGIILLLACVALVLQIFVAIGKDRNEDNRSIVNFSAREKFLIVVAGLFIGTLIGSTSIGGGVLIIPVFLLFFHTKASEAVGTSIAVSLFISALGSVVYILGGYVKILTLLLLSLGSIPGVYLGSRLVVKIREKVLKIIVICIVAGSGISLFFGTSGH